MTTVFVHASPCNAVVSQGGATGHSRGCGIAKGSLVAVRVVPGTTVGGLIVAEVHDDGEMLLTSDWLLAGSAGAATTTTPTRPTTRSSAGCGTAATAGSIGTRTADG